MKSRVQLKADLLSSFTCSSGHSRGARNLQITTSDPMMSGACVNGPARSLVCPAIARTRRVGCLHMLPGVDYEVQTAGQDADSIKEGRSRAWASLSISPGHSCREGSAPLCLFATFALQADAVHRI